MTDTRTLASHLATLLRREHGALGDFLVALSEFDRDRRWVELGHASLFSFLHRELGLSNASAFYRMTAAGLLQRYPELVDPVKDGRLCLSTVGELAKVITPENRDVVVARFFHASKQEAKAIAAELRPAEAPPRRDVVTVLALAPSPKAAPRTAAPLELPVGCAEVLRPGEVRVDVQAPAAPWSPAPARPAVPPDETEPLDGDLRRLHITVTRRFLAKLEAARDALSHSIRDGQAEAVLEAGLDLLLAAHDRRRGLVRKPRKSKAEPSENPRYIPAEVRRAVVIRDHGCCSWAMASGGVCGSRKRLQFDHIIPVALGGTSTVGNVRLLCSTHNHLAATKFFGEAFMEQFSKRGRGKVPAAAPKREPPAGPAQRSSPPPPADRQPALPLQ